MGVCGGTWYQRRCYFTFRSRVQASAAAFAKHPLGATEGGRQVEATQPPLPGSQTTAISAWDRLAA